MNVKKTESECQKYWPYHGNIQYGTHEFPDHPVHAVWSGHRLITKQILKKEMACVLL